MGPKQATPLKLAMSDEVGLGLGVTARVEPFQVSTKVVEGGPVPGVVDEPTSAQKDVPAHETEENSLPSVPGPAAAVTGDHAFPFHSSASGAGVGDAPCWPAARQNDAVTHDTAFSWLKLPDAAGSGASCQVEPFHVSLSGLVAVIVELLPTATHELVLTHETPSSSTVVPLGDGAGREDVDHVAPFQVSISAAVGEVPLNPTATQKEGPAHDTLCRTENNAATGWVTFAHATPFHSMSTGTGGPPWRPTAKHRSDVAQATPLTDSVDVWDEVGMVTALHEEAVTVGGTVLAAADPTGAAASQPDTMRAEHETRPRNSRRMKCLLTAPCTGARPGTLRQRHGDGRIPLEVGARGVRPHQAAASSWVGPEVSAPAPVPGRRRFRRALPGAPFPAAPSRRALPGGPAASAGPRVSSRCRRWAR